MKLYPKVCYNYSKDKTVLSSENNSVLNKIFAFGSVTPEEYHKLLQALDFLASSTDLYKMLAGTFTDGQLRDKVQFKKAFDLIFTEKGTPLVLAAGSD